MYQNNNCCKLFKVISDTLERNANNKLKESDITYSQARVLVYMYSADKEKFPLKELEKVFMVTQQTMAGIVQRLELKGFVAAFEDEYDKRIKKVKLSEKGSTLAKTLVDEIIETEEWITRGLTKEEKDIMYVLLKKVYQNVE